MNRLGYKGGRSVLSSLVPLLLATGVAVAMPPSGPLTFDDFDLNGDGVITRQEMDQVRSQRMAAAGVPVATAAPMQPGAGRGMGRGGRQGHQMPTFKDFDLNGDGFLTEEEFIEARGQRVAQRAKEGRQMRGLSGMMQFSDLDQNRDGKVDENEFQASMLKHQQSHMQHWGPRRSYTGRGRSRLDQDGDGFISQQEFEDARARHMAMRNQPGMTMPTPSATPAFPDIDSDGDGRISTQEMDAFRAARMRQWGPYPR